MYVALAGGGAVAQAVTESSSKRCAAIAATAIRNLVPDGNRHRCTALVANCSPPCQVHATRPQLRRDAALNERPILGIEGEQPVGFAYGRRTHLRGFLARQGVANASSPALQIDEIRYPARVMHHLSRRANAAFLPQEGHVGSGVQPSGFRRADGILHRLKIDELTSQMASENPPPSQLAITTRLRVRRLPCVPSLASALVVRRSQHIPPGKPQRAGVITGRTAFRSPQHWRSPYAPK